MKTKWNTFLVTLILLVSTSSAEGAGEYRIVKRIPVSGDGGFDFLSIDQSSRRLYVSHGTQVDVLDVDSEIVVGRIDGLSRVHGIAIAPGTERGYITNGGTSSVVIFDTRTFGRVGEVPAGKNPDHILYDPAAKRIFAFNNGDGTISVIDAVTGRAAGSVNVGGRLEIGISDGRGGIYVNVEDTSEIVRIDSRNLTVVSRWSLAPLADPTGLGYDPKTRRLFSGGGNKLLAVVDADSGKVITTLPIGGGTDGTEFDPTSRNIFSSCGDGTLSIIHQDGPDRYTVSQTLQTQSRSKTLAVDVKTGKIFLPSVKYSAIPPATADNPKPKAAIEAGSFALLVVQR